MTYLMTNNNDVVHVRVYKIHHFNPQNICRVQLRSLRCLNAQQWPVTWIPCVHFDCPKLTTDNGGTMGQTGIG